MASIPSDLLAASRHGGHNLLPGRGTTWEPAPEPPAILEYWRAVTMRKWAILGLGILCALIAAFIVAQMPPIYRSTALLLIEGARAKSLTNATEIYTGVTPETIYFQTQAEVIRSRDIATRVIRELKLTEHPEFDPRQRTPMGFERWARSYIPSIASLIYAEPVTTMDAAAVDGAVLRQFARSVSVEPVRLSQLIRVNFEARDPNIAATIANAVSDTYTRVEMETRQKSTANAGTWINSRLAELKTKLDQSEKALQTYRDRENMLDSKTTVLSGAGRQFDEMIQRLGEARGKRAEMESAFNQLQAAGGANYESVPAVIRNASVQRAKEMEVEAERRLAEVSRQYGSAHPRYVTAQNEVNAAKANTQAQMQAVVGSVTKEYNAARATERSIEAAMAQPA